MWKRISLSLFLISSFCWTTIASIGNYQQLAPQLDKLDDVAILRFIYPNQSFTVDPQKDQNQIIHRYQVGSVENHSATVLSRMIGKFTQPDQPELLVMVGVETGSDTAAPVATGIYALLLREDKKGTPQLVVRSTVLQRKIAPFGGKL